MPFANVLPFPVMTTQLDSYPNRIRELRTARKMTQQALADEIGTSAVHVGHLELGRRELSLAMMRAIARVFDVPAADILSRDDNPLGASPRSRQLLAHWESADDAGKLAIESVAASMATFHEDEAGTATPLHPASLDQGERAGEARRA